MYIFYFVCVINHFSLFSCVFVLFFCFFFIKSHCFPGIHVEFFMLFVKIFLFILELMKIVFVLFMWSSKPFCPIVFLLFMYLFVIYYIALFSFRSILQFIWSQKLSSHYYTYTLTHTYIHIFFFLLLSFFVPINQVAWVYCQLLFDVTRVLWHYVLESTMSRHQV